MGDQQWVSTLDKKIFQKHLQDAIAATGCTIPEGTLVGSTEAFTAPDINALQWVYTPFKDISRPVTITVYKTSSDKKARALYADFKTSDWKDSPSGFPDKSDNVAQSGIKTSGSSGLAAWTQDPGEYRGSFVVVLSGSTGEALQKYVASIHKAVEKSVIQQGGVSEK